MTFGGNGIEPGLIGELAFGGNGIEPGLIGELTLDRPSLLSNLSSR
jgi:hypothetical protein